MLLYETRVQYIYENLKRKKLLLFFFSKCFETKNFEESENEKNL